MVDVFDGAFWNDEKRRMWDKLGPLYVRLLTSGAQSGEQAMPDALRILIDWDVFNRDAIEYLKRTRLEWVDGLTEVTRERAIQTISDWIEAGEDMPTLRARLSGSGLFSSARARRVAVTEVTRTYADGNQLAWRASGVVSGKVWQTAQDERVCPLCGPLHNKLVEVDGVFIQTPRDIAGDDPTPQALDRAAGLLRHNGAFVGGPPRHPNCRCWLKPVVDENLLREKIRRDLGASEIDAITVRLEA